MDTKVDGFPTIRHFKGGNKVKDYEGKRVATDLANFANSSLNATMIGGRRKKTRKKRGGSTVIIDGTFIKEGDLVEIVVERGTGTVKFKGIFIKEGLGIGGQPTLYFHSTYLWHRSKKWVSIRQWNVPIDEIDSINVISNEKGRTGAGAGEKLNAKEEKLNTREENEEKRQEKEI